MAIILDNCTRHLNKKLAPLAGLEPSFGKAHRRQDKGLVTYFFPHPVRPLHIAVEKFRGAQSDLDVARVLEQALGVEWVDTLDLTPQANEEE